MFIRNCFILSVIKSQDKEIGNDIQFSNIESPCSEITLSLNEFKLYLELHRFIVFSNSMENCRIESLSNRLKTFTLLGKTKYFI